MIEVKSLSGLGDLSDHGSSSGRSALPITQEEEIREQNLISIRSARSWKIWVEQVKMNAWEAERRCFPSLFSQSNASNAIPTTNSRLCKRMVVGEEPEQGMR